MARYYSNINYRQGPYRHALTATEQRTIIAHPALVTWVRGLVLVGWVSPLRPGQVWISRSVGQEWEVDVDVRSASLVPVSWDDPDNKRIKSVERRRVDQQMVMIDHLLSEWLDEYRRVREWDPGWDDGKADALVQGIVDGAVVKIMIRYDSRYR